MTENNNNDNIIKLQRQKTIKELINKSNRNKRESAILFKNIIDDNLNNLPTTYDNLNYYNSTKDGKPFAFYKNDHPLWNNENSLVNRLKRFVDEKYILIDTELNSQRIILLCTIIITLLLIISTFIDHYKKNNKITENTDFMNNIERLILLFKIVSSASLIYFSINNLLIRTSILYT